MGRGEEELVEERPLNRLKTGVWHTTRWTGMVNSIPFVIEGTGGGIDTVPGSLKGKRVVIVGFGAFAVENARTAMLAGASHVTIVARTLNLVRQP